MNISMLLDLPDSAALRLPQVLALTSLSKTYLRTLERRGEFPPRFRLGQRSVAWRAGDVRAWIDSRARIPIDPQDCRFGAAPDVVREQRAAKTSKPATGKKGTK